MKGDVYTIATMDTKGEGLRFLARQLTAAGVAVQTIDVSAAVPGKWNPESLDENI